MNLTNRKALLIVYLEIVPLVMLMVLVARFVLHVEEINVSKRIVFPLALPLFFLALNWLINENHWRETWLSSVELTVSAAGAVSIFYDDFLRYVVLVVLFYLFFRVLNIDILRLPERISNGSP